MEDPQKPNNLRWVKFSGDSVSRWSEIIDQLDLKQIPLNLIDMIKIKTARGPDVELKMSDYANLQEDEIGSKIDHMIDQHRDHITAVEFLVNFDRLESVIFTQISGMFESED